jgi:hypothetical protein
MVGIHPHQCRNDRMRGALSSSQDAANDVQRESFRLSDVAVLA